MKLKLFFVAAAALLVQATSATAESFSARVADVTAGNIFQVETKAKKPQLVVLYGVIAGPSQLAAKQARQYATEKVLNQHVTVRVVDRKPGMTLVEFTLADGSNLSHVMLRNGLLKWDSFTARDDQGLKDLEALAKHDKLGIWRGANPSPGDEATLVAPKAAATDEKLYERRFRAGYDILEGRSWTDENGVRTIVLRGNGEKIEGFEAEVERQVAEENQAIIEEQLEWERQQAEAQAEADRIAYENQLRADEAAAEQARQDNLLMLNQQMLLGGYNRPMVYYPPVLGY